MLPVLCIVNLILLYCIVSTVYGVHILLINVSQKNYSQMLVLEFGVVHI